MSLRRGVTKRDFSVSSPELAGLIAEKDWSKTQVGPREGWSPALRAMVDHVLGNGFPLLLWWEPQYVQFYNDAYRPVLGSKHPQSLGQPGAECFPEIWNVISLFCASVGTGIRSCGAAMRAAGKNALNFVDKAPMLLKASPLA